MPKFSVKKPFTVFVAVIAILVLGVVSYLRMTPDLLPNMDFPYVMIMTTYPGASPEKVEAEITRPMEQAMSTLEHIKEVSSTSSDSYSMVLLEFEDSVNMDTIGVDIQQNINSLSSNWEDTVGTPYVLKINPSMLPVEVAAVSMEGMTPMELTEFLDDTLMNKLEGISGVARISTTGSISQELHVVLDQKKIDDLNARIQAEISGEIGEAVQELEDKKQELEDAQKELEDAERQLNAGKKQLSSETAAAAAQIQQMRGELNNAKVQLQATKIALQGLQEAVNAADRHVAAKEKEVNNLNKLHRAARELEAEMMEAEFRKADIAADPNLTEEEKEAEIRKIDNAIAKKEQSLDASLAAAGVTRDTLDMAVLEKEQELMELQMAVDMVEQRLAEEGLNRNTLKQALADVNGGLEEVEFGLQQLDEAERTLDQTKTTGMMEISGAASEITMGKATIDQALTQVDGGLDTLKESEADALKQADLQKIVTMEMVTQILVAQNFAMPAGYVAQDGVSYMVSVGDEIADVESLENLLLFDMGIEGIDPIYLKDVAAVMLTDNRDSTYAKLDGENSIMLSFEKQSTFATAETTNNINDRFRELEQEYPGLKFVALMNQGDYIYLIVETILNSLLLGALFAIIVLFLFLKDLRPTFITLCSIPISVIFAIVLMYFSGVTINMISLSGLAVAVGMLVDNSVVVIENIYRLRSKGANVIQAAVSGAGQVAGAVTASTLTTVCVFLPIVFVEGITRQLFTDLALTMTYALMASLIVSLTLVPAMASGMLRKEKPVKEGFMERFYGVYGKMAQWSLNHKAIVLLASLVLLVVTAGAELSRGFIFMPEMDMPNVNVTVTMPEGADMETSAALADEVLRRIGTVEGIATTGAMMDVSTATSGGVTSDTYSLTIYLTLSDQNAFGSEVGRRIEELCADMECQVSSSSAMMDMSALSGNGISLNIYADDMDTLQNAARSAAQTLETMEGIASVSDGLEDAAPAVHVAIDRNKAMEKGMTVAQIYMEIATALTKSATPATLQLEGNSTDVVIQKPESAGMSIEDLKSFAFETTDREGETVTFLLGDVATVEQTTSLSTIQRLNQRRYLSVTAQLEPGYNVTLMTTAAQQALAGKDLGPGVSYIFTGENETIMEAVEQLSLMLLLGVLLVYLVMVAQFQSLKSPFIVMFTIPLAFTGGFIALLICGMEVSVISLIGFVMLTGIIVNNGIVLVDYINQLRQEGMERREAILEAGKTRMRPILMTTITTILGLLDMAVNKTAGTAIMQPVAVVCIGGLVYATIMTLFVVPCIYDLLNKKELRTVRDEDLELLEG